jgi:WD40 repeat protein
MLCRFPDRMSVNSVSLRPEGSWVAIGGWGDTGVQLWDLPTHRRVAHLASGEAVDSVAFSPDDSRLAFLTWSTGRKTAWLRVWDCATQSVSAEIPLQDGAARGPTAVDAAGMRLAFSGDSQTIVTFQGGKAVTFWRASNLQKLRWRPVPKADPWVSDLVVTPDLKTAVVPGTDGIVVLDLESGEERYRIDGYHWAWQYSNDGGAIYAIERPAGSPSRQWRWSIQGRALLEHPGLEYNPGRVVRFQGPKFERREVLEEIELSADFLFAPSGRLLAAATTNGMLRVWNLDDRALAHEVVVGAKDFRPVAFSKDASRVWLMQGEGQERDRSVLTEWDPSKERPLRTLSGVRDRVLTYNPDNWLFWRSDEGKIVLYDLHTGRMAHPPIAQARLAEIFSASASSKGDHLLVYHEFGITTVWETASLWPGTPPRQVKALAFGPINSVFSTDGTRLLGGREGKEAVRIWETRAYHELLTLGGEGFFFHNMGFSPDGRLLGAMNASGQIHLWHAPTWQEIEA